MKNYFTLTGKFQFDPKILTSKHERDFNIKNKRTIMLKFDGDVCEYYSWFLKKKGLNLMCPVAGPHVSFVNDRIKDTAKFDRELDTIKKKYNGVQIPCDISILMRSNVTHWWLPLVKESECYKLLMDIRNSLNLGRPEFGLHLTIGHVNDRNLVQSDYLDKIIHKHYK